MRLPKFLCLVSLITVLALLYVWQQTEIFRLAYIGGSHSVVFNELLDKNAHLRYNIERSASLIRIGEKVCASNNLEMPDTYRLVRLVSSGEGILSASRPIPKKESIFSRLFGIKRQAEAKTINR
jgi:hypothetical protein